MTTAKAVAAEALFPTLSIFHSFNGRALEAVWQICIDGSLDKLAFDFGSIVLAVQADENDDSIEISTSPAIDFQKPSGVNVSDQDPWSKLIGASFGWGWLTVNQQGYCDGLLFSFGDLFPHVILNVAASSIKIGTISKTV